MTNSVLWTPLAVGLLLFVLPRRWAGWAAAAGSVLTLLMAISLTARFDSGVPGLQEVTDFMWIEALGIHYRVGIDSLSVYLVLLTAVAWAGATMFSATREWENARVYYLMLGIAETATLGAFLADDLLLFVLFFDLMLIPFYFLFGIWGQGDRVAATLRMIVYTLVGSLLMLVAAIATGVLADGPQSFAMNDLVARAQSLPEGTQHWIFWFFAAAFLIKMPAFLVHGWMAAAYSTAPLPALALLSGVLSKVAAYGFLAFVFPLFPASIVEFQEVLLLIATASVLYGSVMAFTATNVRLVAGYSSIAQLGFITLGIFTLTSEGAQASILQMVNHGLVVVPLFLILAVIHERTKTDDLTEMGGQAQRAPVLAAMFMIVTLATLAMPGSANFIGEFHILLALFEVKVVYAYVAAVGVALAAFYALRLYQRTMHNRLPQGAESREMDFRGGLAIVPLVACIVALALYPKLVFNAFGESPKAERAAVERAH